MARESRDARRERLKREREDLAELGKAVDLALEARRAWYALKPSDPSTTEQAEAYLERSRELERTFRNEQNGVLLLACRLTGRDFTP